MNKQDFPLDRVELFNETILCVFDGEISMYELNDLVKLRKRNESSQNIQNFFNRIMKEQPIAVMVANGVPETIIGRKCSFSSFAEPKVLTIEKDPLDIENVVDNFMFDNRASDLTKSSTKVPVRIYYKFKYQFLDATL